MQGEGSAEMKKKSAMRFQGETCGGGVCTSLSFSRLVVYNGAMLGNASFMVM